MTAIAVSSSPVHSWTIRCRARWIFRASISRPAPCQRRQTRWAPKVSAKRAPWDLWSPPSTPSAMRLRLWGSAIWRCRRRRLAFGRRSRAPRPPRPPRATSPPSAKSNSASTFKRRQPRRAKPDRTCSRDRAWGRHRPQRQRAARWVTVQPVAVRATGRRRDDHALAVNLDDFVVRPLHGVLRRHALYRLGIHVRDDVFAQDFGGLAIGGSGGAGGVTRARGGAARFPYPLPSPNWVLFPD